MLNERIKNKALGSYLCLAAALIALVTAIVFLTTQATAAPLGHTGTTPGIVLLAGVAAAIVFFLVPVRFGALIQAIIYNIALYLVVVQLYFVFADVINHVTFAGGNAGLCVFYMAGTLVACLLSVVACFFKQTKNDDRFPLEGKDGGHKHMGAILAAGVAVVAVCAVVFLVQGNKSNPGSDPAGPSAPPDSSAPFRLNYADNTFADKTIEELGAIPRQTWLDKEANGEVAYFFEGQYTEGFSTIVDPACLDIYCCEDGSMYGSFSGPPTSVGNGLSYVYGYWYNYDENGDYNFVIHITGSQNLDGTTIPTNVEKGADLDVYIFDTDHGAYDWEASLSYGVMGGAITRNINIYGQEYTKAQSLTIDAANLKVFYTGDAFDPGQLLVTAVRGDGATESIWGGRLSYSGFDSLTTGTKTVTGSFLGASATFEVTVEELVTEQYSGTYNLVAEKVPTATEATMLIDYSHQVCTISGVDGAVAITGSLVDVNGNTIVMTLNGSDPFEATILETDGGRQITLPAHQEKVSGWGTSETYDIGECTLTILP